MEVMRDLGLARLTMYGLALMALAGSGCSGVKVSSQVSKELPRYTIKSMVLMPFSAITTPQVHEQGDPFFSSPQSLRRSDMTLVIPSEAEPPTKRTVTVPSNAAEKVTELFWKRLQLRSGVRVIFPSDSVRAGVATGELQKASQDKIGVALAKQLKVDAVLVGLVSVYQERVGSRLGADPPASVGFEIKAVAADGKVLWVGHYYERQRPMTEDIMGFVQRFGAFVTAEELAQYGVDEVLKEFPFGAEATK
jgi:hypothetical protein